MLRLSDFDFDLPDRLIARHPIARRDASRLLRLRSDGDIQHARFSDLPDLLRPSDLLVVNDSAVLSARMFARKEGSGGRVEILLVAPSSPNSSTWKAILGASKRVKVGQGLILDGGGEQRRLEVVEDLGEGSYRLALPEEAEALAERYGTVPLPPYLRRDPVPEDRDRYQTVYANREKTGSVAAPTAGLHFTPELLERLQRRGVERVAVTLHVGPGTFLPVRAEEVSAHIMHAERFEVAPTAAEAIGRARREGRRIVAVGTTTVRVLESFRQEVREGAGLTDLFIQSGHKFRWVDAMITNFHLPRSTLVMLVSAFCGRERLIRAYHEAIRAEYRFYSYGDAMLVEPGTL